VLSSTTSVRDLSQGPRNPAVKFRRSYVPFGGWRRRESKPSEQEPNEGNLPENVGSESFHHGPDSGGFPHPPARHDARHVNELAGAYLRSASRGEPCGALGVVLAEAVLADAAVQLALAVLDGGPFAQARATELAQAVLRNAAADEPADEVAGVTR
jgi:hypothetical protein